MTSSERPACSHAELIDLYVDGAVSGPEREQAERHLAECAGCRDEARALTALRELLAAERVAPEQLDTRVGAPSPARGRRAVAAAAALVGLFGGALAVLAGLVPQVQSAAAAASTLFDFTVTVGLVGAGLLDASWRGMSAAMSSVLQPAGPGLLFGGLAAMGLTVLLFSLLRRGARAVARERQRR
jgi:anti-sigma factor RsiW